MNKRSIQILLLLVAVNIAASKLITIPINKREPEQNENSGFLDNQISDTLINYDQYMYAGNIQVGNSKQTFSVDFDSGSNLLWLTSKNCPTCIKDGYKNFYDCTTVDGCTLTTTPASITYGDGSGVSGHIAKVPVSIPGLAPVSEALLLVEKSIRNANLNSDGLFGLGVYNEHNTSDLPYVTDLYNKGIIDNNEFSFYLGFGKDESQLVFGGVDTSKVANVNEIYYHPIILNGKQNDSQRWSIGMKSVSIGGQSFATAKGQNVSIVDSGTSLVLLRSDIYKSVISYLQKNYTIKTIRQGLSVFYGVKCGTVLPDLSFTLTDTQGVDRTYAVPSSFYILKDGNQCILGLQGMGAGDVQFILGDVFMRRFISIFNYSNKTQGLTQSTANPSDANSIESSHFNIELPLLVAALIALGAFLIIKLKSYIH